MNKIKQLKNKLKWLKVLLIGIPFVYVFTVKLIKKAFKWIKADFLHIVIIIVTASFIIIYILVGYEYFETKRELQELQSIQLIIKPAKE